MMYKIVILTYLLSYLLSGFGLSLGLENVHFEPVPAKYTQNHEKNTIQKQRRKQNCMFTLVGAANEFQIEISTRCSKK